MSEDPHPRCAWTARKLHPVVLLYVALVYVGFVLVAHFGFHSTEAVAALAAAAMGTMVPLVPSVMARLEYRIVESVLEKRKADNGEQHDFEAIVSLDELSHVRPISHGFKFYKKTGNISGLRGFWKLHCTDELSGEVHVEKADRQRVLVMVAERGVPVG